MPGAVGAAHLVEVIEGRPELLHLLLADALGVAGEDLVLNLVDGAGDGGEQLLPAHADVLREGGARECGRLAGQRTAVSLAEGGSELGAPCVEDVWPAVGPALTPRRPTQRCGSCAHRDTGALLPLPTLGFRSRWGTAQWTRQRTGS